jgi:hypothetical protein
MEVSMAPEVLIAIIGAVATVLSALIGTLPAIISKRRRAKTGTRQHYKSEALIIAGSVILAAAILVFGLRAEGMTREKERHSAALSSLIAEARRNGKPYVLQSVVNLVRIEDTQDNSGQIRNMSVRSMYVVRPLRDISAEEDVFSEQFTSSITNVPPQHWFGSQKEVFNTVNGNLYSVEFQANEDDTYTIVTGANYQYRLPLPSNRPVPAEIRTLQGNEDSWMYPNSEDYIGEIVIVIESPTTHLRPLERSKVRITNRQPNLDDPFLNERAGAQNGQRSLSARWTTVRPNEKVGILYSW